MKIAKVITTCNDCPYYEVLKSKNKRNMSFCFFYNVERTLESSFDNLKKSIYKIPENCPLEDYNVNPNHL